MIYKIAKDLSGALLVVSHLRASVGMRECDYFAYAALYYIAHSGKSIVCLLCNGCCNIIHSADRRNDPYLVPYRHFTVRSLITHKESVIGIFCFI